MVNVGGRGCTTISEGVNMVTSVIRDVCRMRPAVSTGRDRLKPSPSALSRRIMLAPIPACRARDHFTQANMPLNYSALGLRDRGWRISRYRRKALLRRLTKMKRKSLQGSLCAVARALDVIGDWWSLLIIANSALGIAVQHQPVGAHFPAFQPVQEAHAEQIGLHLSVRHHQRRHRTLDKLADC